MLKKYLLHGNAAFSSQNYLACHPSVAHDSDHEGNTDILYIYVTIFWKIGLIAGLAKIDFFPEKAFTKFKYCLCKI